MEANGCRWLKYIIREILKGLSLLADAGLVHCDMKPDNILVDLDYRTGTVNSVKIIDLGSGIKFS